MESGTLRSPARGSINTDKRLEFILILLGMPVIKYIKIEDSLEICVGGILSMLFKDLCGALGTCRTRRSSSWFHWDLENAPTRWTS